MKRICILLSSLFLVIQTVQARQTATSEHWKRVDSLILADLPRSASTEIEKLLTQLSPRHPERIKAYILLGHLKIKYSEQGFDSLFVRVKHERNQAQVPMQNLYDFALTNLYIVYAIHHQATIRDRQESDDPRLPMREWSYKRFRDTVSMLYKQILTPELKKHKSSEYTSISTNDNLNGMPTLYELMSYSILDQMLLHFPNDAIVADMLKTIQNTNSSDPEAIAISRYRVLEYYHRYDAQHSGWIPELKEILKLVKGKSLYPDMLYNLAYVYYACNKYYQADSLAQEIIRHFPNDKNSQMAQAMINYLHTPNIEIEDDQQAPYPDKKWLLRITSQKTKELHFNIYSATPYQYLNPSDSSFAQAIRQVPLKTWSQSLPEKEFYKSYSYRYEMPALPQGCYLLEIKPNEKNSEQHNYFFFQVTSLNCYSTTKLVSVNDRKNGKRLENTTVTRYIGSPLVERSTINSGEDGLFRRDSLSEDHEYICISSGEARSWISFYSKYYSSSDYRLFREKKGSNTALIFTDRQLYRPGQRIQFKGIGFKHVTYQSFIPSKDREIAVNIYIPEQQAIVQRYKTNKYGSFYGYYDIPRDMPSGTTITLGCDLNRVEVRIEEYKLPKIEIDVNIRDKYYSPGEQVDFHGKVKSLTGVNTGGCTVSCTSSGKSYSCFTDRNGQFTLKLPHNTHYWLKIVATTPAGEVCTLERNFSINQRPLRIELSLPDMSLAGKPLPIDLQFKTATDVSIHHPFHLKIESLQKESIWFHSKDSVLMSRKAFNKIAPYDTYDPKDRIFNPSRMVMDTSFNSQASMTERVNQLSLREGYYQVTVTAIDSLNKELSATRTCKIINPLSKKSLQEHFYYYVENKEYLPGDTLKLMLGSACKDMNLFVVKTNRSKEKHFDIMLNQEQKVIYIPIEEEDQGNYLISIMGAGEFQTVKGQINVKVPYFNKDLNVELTSFRNKVISGDEETLQVKVTDSEGKGVSCEILAYMYDHALDKLYSSQNRFFNIPYPPFEVSIYGIISPSLIGRPGNFNHERRYTLSPIILNTPAIFNNFDITSRKKGILEYQPPRRLSAACAQDSYAFSYDSGILEKHPDPKPDNQNIKIRQNLQETAFFYPFIRTDKKGIATFKYTAPESLSRWRLNLVAHSQEMGLGSNSSFVTVYKKVMVNLSVPRFLTEGDSIRLVTRIDNLTDETLPLESRYELFTIHPVSGKYEPLSTCTTESTRLSPNSSVNVTTTFRVPEGCTYVACRISAIAGSHTDGEERKIPVISKQVFLTESVPFTLLPGESKKVVVDKIKQRDSKDSHKARSLILDLSPDPTSMIIETLPVLEDESCDCNSVLFNRFYGNRIASAIYNRYGKTWIEKLKAEHKKDTTTITSPLTKNSSLKQFQLDYTPWLTVARNQTEQRQRLLDYFAPSNLDHACKSTLKELFNRQQSDGSFTWFKGIPTSDQYTTLHIAAGFGRLFSQGLLKYKEFYHEYRLQKLISYLDNNIAKNHKTASTTPTPYECYYLYARGMFSDSLPETPTPNIKKILLKKAAQTWVSQPTYLRMLIATALWQEGDQSTAQDIIKSLLENATITKESGMYWEYPTISFAWYMRPVETQSVMIELLTLVGQEKHQRELQQMRQWLMLQKRSNSWGYSTATTDAIYAFLLDTKTANDSSTVISARVGNETITTQGNFSYHRTNWDASQITPGMNQISVTRTASATPISFGAVYYQYSEERNNVESFQTDLSVKRDLYRTSPSGKLTRVLPGEEIRQGECVTVRITLNAAQDMEYLQMRDLRGAAFEPESQLSRYEYQDWLIYFKTVKDASVDFHINRMRKGTYIIEYKIIATQSGEFSCGYTEIQSMFAPEFGSRTDGYSIKIKE